MVGDQAFSQRIRSDPLGLELVGGPQDFSVLIARQ